MPTLEELRKPPPDVDTIAKDMERELRALLPQGVEPSPGELAMIQTLAVTLHARNAWATEMVERLTPLLDFTISQVPHGSEVPTSVPVAPLEPETRATRAMRIAFALEWSGWADCVGYGGYRCCPECGAVDPLETRRDAVAERLRRPAGHAPSCELGKLCKEMRNAPEGDTPIPFERCPFCGEFADDSRPRAPFAIPFPLPPRRLPRTGAAHVECIPAIGMDAWLRSQRR